MAENLNQLSDGRLILGVGIGWAKQEFEALGVDFHNRGRLTDELLRAIKTTVPIWVGGSSEAGLRRAVRYADAWHPLRERLDRMRENLDRLSTIADEEGRPVPGFAPRILLRLTDQPLPDDERVAGEGTIDQVLADLDVLRLLGAQAVVLDPFVGDPAETERPEVAWQALATVNAQGRWSDQ
jgi:alkanesulfonate monooxygenase SsuD/methylene tetrahydromethanopterin reductase-like flavin-dependent oxidoreductase (luciferase family)